MVTRIEARLKRAEKSLEAALLKLSAAVTAEQKQIDDVIRRNRKKIMDAKKARTAAVSEVSCAELAAFGITPGRTIFDLYVRGSSCRRWCAIIERSGYWYAYPVTAKNKINKARNEVSIVVRHLERARVLPETLATENTEPPQ